MISQNYSIKWRVALAALLFSASWSLKADLGHNEALRLRQEGKILSFEEILGAALKRYPGALLLESDLEQRRKNIFIYELEILTTSGVVRELKINASDGQIVKDQIDD
ncbi:PepSY domain-containing protein [Candidatus Nitrosacidococcus tergens]|uniref:Peptidase propeptide and YPEB domain protein n=1 Tax=Candidatus Nitrosacidococcus tergens TaxID=553981 RepID=A0A7G1QAC5_9GAMM|nr:PepSY domain-containing protein [Candidatus Nitrosacidococcus tergens]CAB1276382.1 Peptidase propeptide and YPEB domain protein [Candidatus Nitrosacidococcus tergens]